jgi:L-Ala-D/L-Glu epimerase
MKIELVPYSLTLKHPFKISDFSRTFTPIAFIRLEEKGVFGYGECSMPPYLGESIESATDFMAKVDLSQLHLDNLSSTNEYIDSIDTNNNAAKAALDIALHDLSLKLENQTLYKYLGVDPKYMPLSTFTLGIDRVDIMKEKVKDAIYFERLKIKLGTDDDKAIIQSIRSISDKPIIVDANRGWKTKEHAIDMIDFLEKYNCLLVEQPLELNQLEDMYWLKERSSLALFADESCKRLKDIENIKECFHGINIKLMKSTGIHEATKMIQLARSLNLSIMIGCMSESSCGIMSAAALAPLCDYADLDSPWMVTNNPFIEPSLSNGKIQLNDLPGIGVELNDKLLFN